MQTYPMNGVRKQFQEEETIHKFVELTLSDHLGLSCYIEEVWSRPETWLTLLTWTFPLQMQRCIYTTNWIERLNKKYKKTIGMGASMPSDKSALFLLASAAMEEPETTCVRKIYQWKFWKQKKEEWIKTKKELTHFLGHYFLFGCYLNMAYIL